nr:acyl-CoA dehydrogenase family protein [Ardenticatena sp.]
MNLDSILATIRDFVERELIPLERRFLHEGFRAILPDLQAKRRDVQEMGLWTPHLPPEYGGLGLSLPEFARVSEVLGRTPLGHYVFNCQAPDIGNMELLLLHGTDAQKERWLWPLIRGDIRSCFAMTEPHCPGSNPIWLETLAIRTGNEYVIDGHKWFASSADGAAFAIVMAITNPAEDNPYQRASQIIVPTDTPGFTLVRNIPVMGEAGEDYMSHGEIRLEDVRVPVENLLGPEGEGFRLAQERLGPGRIHHCMRWIGICERTFDLMCRRAVQRRLTPHETLADQQMVQAWIAESRAEIDAARMLVLDAAEKVEAHGSYGARVAISTIKFYVAGVLQRVLDRAIQVHGALGMTDDTPLAFWFRHERAARIYDGPDEVHKRVVARAILKQYRQHA